MFTKTVPAHNACNAKFASDNDYFRDVLIMEAGVGDHPEVQKIRSGEFERKLRDRPREISTFLRDARILPQLTPGGIYVGHAPVLPVDRERIDRVLYNVMRGVFYLVNKEPMPLDWQWGISREHELPPWELKNVSDQMGSAWHTFGDDVFACRYIFDYDRGAMQCFMRFYRRRIYIGGAFSVAHIRAAKEQFKNSLLITPPSQRKANEGS
ncbi:MAG: hypothetical protein ACLP9L_20745 [Thermoguttaceae bacterium]